MVSVKPPAVSRPIVLVGFMGSGKSTIGRALAEPLDLRFVDSDVEIERAFGLGIPEIFQRHGEAEFRRAEREIVARLVAGEPKVLSFGGGAYADRSTREIVNEKATTIWLDPPFELILERIGRSGERPLAVQRSPDELRALWEERRRHYAEAQIRVATSQEAVGVAVGQILDLLT